MEVIAKRIDQCFEVINIETQESYDRILDDLDEFVNMSEQQCEILNIKIPQIPTFNFNQNIELHEQEVKLINQIQKKPQQEFTQKEVGTKQYNGIIWDYSYDPPIPIITKYQVTINKNQILYSKDGTIIRCDDIKDTSQRPQVLENLEQIKHLKWIGQYDQNNKKIGLWKATWKGELIQGAGGEYRYKLYQVTLYKNDGKKEGIWWDIFQNYWTQAQVYEIGEYQDDRRKGVWKYQFKDKDIQGGEYNIKGQKCGKWKELTQTPVFQKEILYIVGVQLYHLDQ